LFVKPVQEALFGQDQPLCDVQRLEQRVSHSLARDRFSAQVLGLFALTVTAVGVSGGLSYVTAQRTQEIGISMALGAQSSDVVKAIMGHGTK
jgi:putative ABC transport system permease protein